MTSPPRIAIIGGGPGGLMLARLLQCHGLAASVFERDAHAGERPQGGSLDLHAGTGQRAIRLAGLEQAFLQNARRDDQGDRLYAPDGALLFDRGGEGDERPEIDRTLLRQILLDSLQPGIVRWNSRVSRIEPQGGMVRVTINDDLTSEWDIVIGADGAWSRIRTLLTEVIPVYEGVTMVELGFSVARHPGVDALVGRGKMFAVGDNRVLIGQRNGCGHIRGYAGLRMPQAQARAWSALSAEELRPRLRAAFDGWAPRLIHLVEAGDMIGVRPMHALPPGHRWPTRPGVTLLGDAAHLMSPFSGEGVNLAFADAADLAGALASSGGWGAVETCEASIMARAATAGAGAAAALATVVSSRGVAPVLSHYRDRTAA